MSHQVHIAIWLAAAGHDPMGPLIKFLTRGDGTHAAFVRGTGLIVENFYPHVRERKFAPGECRHVELYRLEGMTPAGSLRLETWIDRELANPAPYSIRDLFRYAINLPPVRGHGSFCSQWVLRGLRQTQPAEIQPLTRLEYPDFAPPSDLRISPRLHPVALWPDEWLGVDGGLT